MRWERGHRSRHVEDRRGQRSRGRTAATVGGGGALLVVLLAVVGQALGIDVSGLFGGGSSTSSSSTSSPGGEPGAPPDPATDPDRELVQFVHFVIDDIQATFEAQFRAQGTPYRWATLVLFTDEVSTRCGEQGAAIGPFYCPPDEKAYIDLSFFRLLDAQLGAGGDFAQAYVLAHEIGHHLQTVLGVDADVRRRAAREPRRDNELSVRQELQADCFAGVWAHASKQRALLEAGDIEEAVNAAAQIGDDRLQQRAGQKVNPETWSHGSSAQRVRWFRRGLEAGSLDACDTFAADAP